MKLEKNVLDFIEWGAKEIGKVEEDLRSRDMVNRCDVKEIKSPIEQLLYSALEIVRRLNGIDDEDYILENNKEYVIGLEIIPQHTIGKYRTDFLVGYRCLNKEKTYIRREVIVECDSQKWHERDEKERRYEKMRDRYFQSRGYKVFHFTGSEILKSPMEIAIEVIAEVMNCKKEDLIFDSGIN